MKMAGAKKVHYDSGPNMTPLVDVVMVILIFLMLAGSFGGQTHYLLNKQGIRIKGAGGKPDPNKVLDTPINLNIASMGEGGDDYGFSVSGEGIKGMQSADELEAILKGKLDKFVANGTTVDKLEVILHPSTSVKYNDLLQVYQAALAAGFTKIAFAAGS